jgi:hypothetical protein
MANIIDITEKLGRNDFVEMLFRGIQSFCGLDEETQKEISHFWIVNLQAECRIGLGLADEDSHEEDYGELPLFGMIESIFNEAAHGCYFCDSTIDANATEFNRKTYLCPECAFKLANYTQFLGINPKSILPWVFVQRKIQKSRYCELLY